MTKRPKRFSDPKFATQRNENRAERASGNKTLFLSSLFRREMKKLRKSFLSLSTSADEPAVLVFKFHLARFPHSRFQMAALLPKSLISRLSALTGLGSAPVQENRAGEGQKEAPEVKDSSASSTDDNDAAAAAAAASSPSQQPPPPPPLSSLDDSALTLALDNLPPRDLAALSLASQRFSGVAAAGDAWRLRFAPRLPTEVVERLDGAAEEESLFRRGKGEEEEEGGKTAAASPPSPLPSFGWPSTYAALALSNLLRSPLEWQGVAMGMRAAAMTTAASEASASSPAWARGHVPRRARVGGREGGARRQRGGPGCRCFGGKEVARGADAEERAGGLSRGFSLFFFLFFDLPRRRRRSLFVALSLVAASFAAASFSAPALRRGLFLVVRDSSGGRPGVRAAQGDLLGLLLLGSRRRRRRRRRRKRRKRRRRTATTAATAVTMTTTTTTTTRAAKEKQLPEKKSTSSSSIRNLCWTRRDAEAYLDSSPHLVLSFFAVSRKDCESCLSASLLALADLKETGPLPPYHGRANYDWKGRTQALASSDLPERAGTVGRSRRKQQGGEMGAADTPTFGAAKRNEEGSGGPQEQGLSVLERALRRQARRARAGVRGHGRRAGGRGKGRGGDGARGRGRCDGEGVAVCRLERKTVVFVFCLFFFFLRCFQIEKGKRNCYIRTKRKKRALARCCCRAAAASALLYKKKMGKEEVCFLYQKK